MRSRPSLLLSLIAMVSVALPSCPALGQPTTTASPAEPTLEQRLERVVEELEEARARLHVAGLSIAIVVDDKVVLERGFGERDVERKLPADEHTIYAIGSTTKAFTAALAGMNVDDELMTWDDPVQQHVPGFSLSDPEIAGQVTVRDALCHRTGLASMNLAWFGGKSDFEDILGCVGRAELKDAFRESFNYNNCMYLVAGRAAANAAETDWDKMVRSRILEPLGMDESTTSVADLDGNDELARGYRWDEQRQRHVHMPMRPLDNIAPAGAINSSVHDMARWVRLQLNRGEIDGKRLLESERLDEMWAPQIGVSPGVEYALGWMVRQWNGRRLLEHSGGIDGFTAQVALLPDDGVGFVLLSNANGSAIGGLATTMVFDALVGEWRDDDDAVDLAAVEKYLGKYHFDVMDADVTVLVQNGRLAVDVPGQMVYELRPPDEQGRRAFVDAEQITVEFNENDAGEVISLILHQGPMTFEMFREGVEIEPEITAADAKPFLGRYYFEPANHDWTVLIQNGRLAVSVPGEMVYELHPPDDEGWRVFRATDQFKLRFKRDEEGDSASMTFQRGAQEFTLPRVSDDDAGELPALAEVQRMVEDAHGVAAWRAMENVRYVGSIDLVHQGITGEVTVTAAGDRRYCQLLELGTFGSIEVCVNDDQGWRRLMREELIVFGEEELATAQTQHPAVMFTGWETVFEEARVIGVATRDEREVILVELTPAIGPMVQLTIDADTGLVVRAEGMMHVPNAGSIPFSAEYEDHRTTEGLTLPHRIVAENAITGRSVITVERVETNVELPGDTFVRPQS